MTALITDEMLLEQYPVKGSGQQVSDRRVRRQTIRREAGALARIREQVERDLAEEQALKHATVRNKAWSDGYQHALQSVLRLMDAEKSGGGRG